jgi:hypothetical protein
MAASTIFHIFADLQNPPRGILIDFLELVPKTSPSRIYLIALDIWLLGSYVIQSYMTLYLREAPNSELLDTNFVFKLTPREAHRLLIQEHSLDQSDYLPV